MIKIIRYFPVNKGAIEGNISIEIIEWNLTINDITIFNKDGRRWISFPSRQYEVENVKKYAPYIVFLPEHKALLEKRIFSELLTYQPKDAPPAQAQQGKGSAVTNNETLPF